MRITADDLRRLWRVVLCVVGAQAAGGIVGGLLGSVEQAWLGGAMASAPAALGGILWHARAEGFRKDARLLLGIGGLAFLLTAFAVAIVLPRSLREKERVAALARMGPAGARRLEVQDLARGGAARTIIDRDMLSSFAAACADARRFSPSPKDVDRSWRVVVDGPAPFELHLALSRSDPERCFGRIVETGGTRTWYLGNFESRALRGWVEAHLLK
jgi:hypothetical protein